MTRTLLGSFDCRLGHIAFWTCPADFNFRRLGLEGFDFGIAWVFGL